MTPFAHTDRWSSQRLGLLFQEQKEKNTDFSRKTALKFVYGSIEEKPEYKINASLVDTYSKYTKVNTGDIIINCLNLNYDFASQRVAIVKENGIITSAYISLRARTSEVNPTYYCYYFKAMDSKKMLHGMGTGIRLTLSYNELRNISVPVPSHAEQDQIVRFLDWKVSEIRKIILSKRNSLHLLTELIKTAFASLIAESTEKVRLKRVVSLDNDFMEIDPNDYYQKAGMYNRGRGIFLRKPVKGSDMGDSKFQHIYRNRLMISGQFAWEDAVFVTDDKDEQGLASHRYYLLKSQSTDVPVEYLFGYFISQKGLADLQICSHGSAGRNRPLNINELLRVEIPIVHNTEAISRFCKLIRSYIKMRPLVLKEEETLEELQNKIITDVVTGKIDIRDITVPEYEHADDIIKNGNTDENNNAIDQEA
ncbi:Type I restriction-modification system specificity (S) subunit of unknown recognition sequence [Bifidobacterium actinocoloniiforme DSM 22766]|uniref:Type I restriction modification DNA specificity domain-containing protein n=1 Tax=Bifidobacterium actinocoloniiforme DSM 22766 TaxID=1437605 RepID=A0A086Z2E8_9BIFI|nr:restriction endonuclease subunit S [Bifidobacterium actinocoloniiforme]KFI40698.1 Type I restriction-modification system specificity (S) subunit of unknown recognition sequence [Bifidobacterium actinocoloniiforme DSM 22766]